MGVKISDLRFFHPNALGVAAGGTLDVFQVDAFNNVSGDVSIDDDALTQADDFWNNAIFRGLTGNLVDVYAHVEDFIAANDRLTFPFTFPLDPVVADTFNLIQSLTNSFSSDLEIPGMDSTNLSNVTGFDKDYFPYFNGSGAGDLRFTFTGTLLDWKPPGESLFGPAIDVSSFSNGDEVVITGQDHDQLPTDQYLPGEGQRATPGFPGQ